MITMEIFFEEIINIVLWNTWRAYSFSGLEKVLILKILKKLKPWDSQIGFLQCRALVSSTSYMGWSELRGFYRKKKSAFGVKLDTKNEFLI